MEEPFGCNFTDRQFGAENAQFVPYVIEHQLSDRLVGQCSEPLLEQTGHHERAQNPLAAIPRTGEPSLFIDQALHADFFVFAVVVVHGFTFTPVLPI